MADTEQQEQTTPEDIGDFELMEDVDRFMTTAITAIVAFRVSEALSEAVATDFTLMPPMLTSLATVKGRLLALDEAICRNPGIKRVIDAAFPECYAKITQDGTYGKGDSDARN